MSDCLLCGWRVRSQLPLPELSPWNGDDRAEDITIAFGHVPDRLEAAQDVGPMLQIASAGAARLEIPRIARFLISGGRSVVINSAPGIAGATLRLFLFGTVLAILCNQRGLIPLHASCVRIAGRAVAFGGKAGLGKSTLAAALVRRGCVLIADDVCVVDAAPVEGPLVYPVLPRIKLWQDSIEALGIAPERLERVRDGMEKFSVPASSAFDGGAVRLGAIYLLRDMRQGFQDPPRRYAGFEAAGAITNSVYRPRIWKAMGRESSIARAVIAMLAGTAVYDLPVQRDFGELESVAQRLLCRHGATAKSEPAA